MKSVKVFMIYIIFCVTSYAQSRIQEDMVKFIDREIRPVLVMVMDAKMPYPIINERVKEQDRLIRKIFGKKPIKITLRPTFHSLGPRVRAASGIDEAGNPKIVMFVPSIMDGYANFGESFSSLVRTVMHERDHLTEMTMNRTHVDLGVEIHMQALTTKFVTVPMVEKYNINVSPNDRKHYNAWVDNGRDEKSFGWRQYMEKLLAPALKFQ